MAGRPDPGGAVDVDAGVAVLGECGSPTWMPIRTRTSRSPGHGSSIRPRWPSTAAADCVVERLERGEELVAVRVDDRAAVACDARRGGCRRTSFRIVA